MGQEVSLNALQLARITAVVANGGYLVQPHLVTRIVEPGRSRARRALAEPVRVISPATARAISQDSRRRRRAGHRRPKPPSRASPSPARPGRRRRRESADTRPGSHIPNFAGFAPAENPRCVAVVVLEEPQGKYYAADVAAPLFSRVMSQALGILRVAPHEQRCRPASWPRPLRSPRSATGRARPRVGPAARVPDAARRIRESTPDVLGSRRARRSRSSRAPAFSLASRAPASSSPRTRRPARPPGRAPCTRSSSPTTRRRRPGRPAAAPRRRHRLPRAP